MKKLYKHDGNIAQHVKKYDQMNEWWKDGRQQIYQNVKLFGITPIKVNNWFSFFFFFYFLCWVRRNIGSLSIIMCI